MPEGGNAKRIAASCCRKQADRGYHAGMNPKRFFRIVNNPRHIPSIFNYCDRWCERCPLTLRCSV
jgi:hypothetical protein